MATAAVLAPSSSTTSSMDKAGLKQESAGSEPASKHNSPVQNKSSLTDTQPAASQPQDSKTTTQTTEPLAPPPRPAAGNATDTPDYFSALHNNSSEFNPFEQSFGAPSVETPGGTRLPPVAALTSPAISGPNNGGGYNFSNSLRSGPLSPAMLEGPQSDYFGNLGSRGFPTPNESSLRTGLTPGGGGSMFPAPSPTSQALFNQLASGAATPGTLEFQRTALAASSRPKNGQYPATTQADQSNAPAMDTQHHDATDAANGLFMLAKGGQANQFAVPNAPAPQMQTRGQDQKRSTRASASLGGSEDTGREQEEDAKPNARAAKGKKNIKSELPAVNGRRKSEASHKGANKKQKSNMGNANVDPALADDMDDMNDMDDMDDDDDMEGDMDGLDQKDPKKMTDEEKRRNFLERNRVAALKCRQRKKQWLANLQAKVEMYSAQNDNLNTQVAELHEEIRNLRALLMGHKECPVGHAQGIGQFLNGMQDPAGYPHQQVNPYGMAMSNGAGMQAGMQRS